MQKLRRLVLGALVIAVTGLVFAGASEKKAEMAKPGPEHQKLHYFVGKWTSEGDSKESPFGPGGKFTMTDNCKWFEGNFSVVCHSEGKGPNGLMKGLGIMGYNPEEKVYTYYGVDNSVMNMLSIPRGTVEGDTWTYNDESKMGGKMIKSRYIIKQLSQDAYTFKWEMAGEGGAWSTLMEGKSTRAK